MITTVLRHIATFFCWYFAAVMAAVVLLAAVSAIGKRIIRRRERRKEQHHGNHTESDQLVQEKQGIRPAAQTVGVSGHQHGNEADPERRPAKFEADRVAARQGGLTPNRYGEIEGPAPGGPVPVSGISIMIMSPARSARRVFRSGWNYINLCIRYIKT